MPLIDVTAAKPGSTLGERWRRAREMPPELSGFVRMWRTTLTRSGDSENVVPGSFAASP
jgi:hypothetical protein